MELYIFLLNSTCGHLHEIACLGGIGSSFRSTSWQLNSFCLFIKGKFKWREIASLQFLKYETFHHQSTKHK